MKIVQIIDTLNVGGAERVLVTLANLLHQKGHEVTVITLLNPGPLAPQLLPDIPILSLHRGWKWNPVKMFQLIRWCRLFEIVHVHSSHTLRYVFLAAWLFRLKKCIFFHEHYGDIEIDDSVQWHQRIIYPRTILIGVSSKICDWAIHRLKMPVESVHLLMNTVPKEEAAIFDLQQNAPLRLLTVANIRKTKHLEFAIEVLKEFNQKKAATLTIVGQLVEFPYYLTLRQLIEKYRLQDQVHFIHDCNKVQPILKHYDLALHTAKSESGPLVLIEYLAQGLPFISYNTGEVVTKIQPDLPEHIMPQFDPSSWVATIARLLAKDQTELRKELISVYDAYFSEEVYYQQCLNIYQKSLAY